MHIHRLILTQHRLQRLVLWTLTLLHWIAATLCGRHVSQRHATQRGDFSLQWLTRQVTNLLMLRAVQIGRFKRQPIRYWRHGRDLRRRHLRRSLLGSRLRRALKHKDFATHIARLIAFLRDLDTHATRLIHNIRHRRRLWRSWTRIIVAALLLGPPAPPPAFSDSS